jgi:ABC-2 type transport system permease protein
LIRIFFSVLRLGITHRFAYRLEVVVAVISALIVITINASVWGAVVDGRETVAGLNPVEMSTYVIVAWVVMVVAGTRLDELLGHRFRTGEVAADLIRPLDLQLFLTVRDLGRAVASIGVTALPVLLLGGLFFPFAWPSHWWTWPVLAVSLLLAFLIAAQVAFLTGIASFRLKNIIGLSRLKAAVVALLSGAVIPLYAMPAWAKPVVMWLPFQGMAHAPASLFLERVPPADLWHPLGFQLFWVVALLVMSRLAWRWALQHLTVQGG